MKNTKLHILSSAKQLFLEHGPQACSMRQIAKHAGVSLGNAYYYFPSKNHIILAFYEQMQLEQVKSFRIKVVPNQKPELRLRQALEAYLAAISSYHGMSENMMQMATPRTSPLNPFSRETQTIRKSCYQAYREIWGKGPNWAPLLIWLYQMGLTVFWVYDQSKNQVNTKNLLAKTYPLLTLSLNLSKLPLLGRKITSIMNWLTQNVLPKEERDALNP